MRGPADTLPHISLSSQAAAFSSSTKHLSESDVNQSCSREMYLCIYSSRWELLRARTKYILACLFRRVISWTARSPLDRFVPLPWFKLALFARELAVPDILRLQGQFDRVDSLCQSGRILRNVTVQRQYCRWSQREKGLTQSSNCALIGARCWFQAIYNNKKITNKLPKEPE